MDCYKEFSEMYQHLKEAFEVDSKEWSEIHEHYSPYMFCPANRLSIAGEYLVWKWFALYARKYKVPYYLGIDRFLEEYKEAIEQRINLGDITDTADLDEAYKAKCEAEEWCIKHDVPLDNIRRTKEGYKVTMDFKY